MSMSIRINNQLYTIISIVSILVIFILLIVSCGNSSDFRSEGGDGYFWDQQHLNEYRDHGKHDDYVIVITTTEVIK